MQFSRYMLIIKNFRTWPLETKFLGHGYSSNILLNLSKLPRPSKLDSVFVSFISCSLIIKWRIRDSNSWPPACKAGALPTELIPHIHLFDQMENTRFELVTSCLQGRRSPNWANPPYSFIWHLPMGLSGLEPPTSLLSGVRSNRLSYKPISWAISPFL